MLASLSERSMAIGWSAFALVLFIATACLLMVVADRRASRQTQDPQGEAGLRRSAWVVAAVFGFLVAASVGVAVGAYAVALPPLVLLLWSVRGIAEDVASGVVLVGTRRLRAGDWIRWNGTSGRIQRVGFAHLVVELRDHSVIHVAHREAIRGDLQLISAGGVDAAVETALPLPDGLSPADARELATVCAATSPYASLHQRPRTILVAERDGTLTLRVRGYVCDAQFGEAYRSHIVEAWYDATRLGA
jgi:small-conductance mechanosensitive channel